MVRDAKWDNAKFFLMFCVVLGHMLNMNKVDSQSLHALHLFIYLFHMPAFLFLSGLFSKHAVREKRYDRAASFLLLYLFMMIFQFVVSSAINGKAASFNLFTVSGVPWFALTLFFYYLITMAVQRWNPNLVLIVAVALGIMAGYEANLGNFLAGMRVVTMYPFFFLGYLCPLDQLGEMAEKKILKVFSAIILVATLAICYVGCGRLYKWLPFLRCKDSYETLDLLPWGGVYRGLYYLVVLVLIACIVILIPKKRTIFAVWGSRTMQVFALHYPILLILNRVLHLQNHMAELWPSGYKFLVPAVAFGLTVVLSLKVFEPFFRWLTNPIREKEG